MKNISVLLIIFLAASCGNKDLTGIQEKQEQLSQKEKDLVSLKKEILDLKREIQSLDTNARDNAIAVMAMEIKKELFKNPFEVHAEVFPTDCQPLAYAPYLFLIEKTLPCLK